MKTLKSAAAKAIRIAKHLRANRLDKALEYFAPTKGIERVKIIRLLSYACQTDAGLAGAIIRDKVHLPEACVRAAQDSIAEQTIPEYRGGHE